MKLKYILLLVLIELCISCIKKDDNKIILFLNQKESTINDPELIMNTMSITYGDSIFIERTYGSKKFKSSYFKVEDGIYEGRHRGMDETQIYKIDSILTFARKDTSFTYNSAFDFPTLLFQLSLTDCNYAISKSEEGHITVKQSLIDTTYKEIFFYDKDFVVYKFINYYGNNRCVYIKE